MPRDGSGRSHNAVEEDPALGHDIAHGVGKDPAVSPFTKTSYERVTMKS